MAASILGRLRFRLGFEAFSVQQLADAPREFQNVNFRKQAPSVLIVLHYGWERGGGVAQNPERFSMRRHLVTQCA
jgi:hypothetical protein